MEEIRIIKDISNSNSLFEKLPICATPAFLKTQSDEYGWFCSNQFILPFYVKRKLIFKRLIFTNESIYLTKNAIIQDEKLFLNQIVEQSRLMGVDFISQPSTNVVFNCYPNGAIYSPFGSYQVDLTLDEQVLFSNLHSKHRNVIKRARREKVQTISGDAIAKECYKIYRNTMERQSMGFVSWEYIERLKTNLGDKLTFYICELDGSLQGCAIIPWNEYGAYYMIGGSIPEPFSGALNLMHWEIMMDMKARGVELYDFVGARINPQPGSKLEGIQRFKIRFGAKMKKGYLWKYPINNFYCMIYQKLATLRSRIDGKGHNGDIIDQERYANGPGTPNL